MKRQRHFLKRAAILFALQIFSLAGRAQNADGTGLTARYYDAIDFATAVTTRTDTNINFDFGTAIPAGTAITEADSYSVAWSGQIEAGFSETYTFFLTADDAARLWIDDELIVQRHFVQNTGEMRAQARMKAGHRVNFRLEYWQNSGPAKVKLEWASPSQLRQVVPQNRLYPGTEVPNGGSVMREVWHGLTGTSISTLTSASTYPSKPASRELLTSFECLATDWEDNFGTRVTGFLRAPVTGAYTFAVSGDDVVQLSLSTDTNSANKSVIASAASATGFRQWTAQPSQISTTRNLVAGGRYYIELLHKEGTGPDHWSVGWMKPGDTAFSIIPGTVLMMPNTTGNTPTTSLLFNTLATEHPRLIATRERFLALKQKYVSPTSSSAKSWATSIVNSANGDLTAALNGSRSDRDRLMRLATAWWLTNDSRYGERAWEILDYTRTNGDYTVKWKGLTVGVLAIGYDWLYPYWTAERRTSLGDFIVSNGINSISNSYSNNIGLINDGGMIMGGLAIGTYNESKAEAAVSKAGGQLNAKIDDWQSMAGAWHEGTDYGIFAKWGFVPALDSMETALGSCYSYGRAAGLFTARREPLTIASNTRQRFTFSDIGTGSHNSVGWANWWARRFNALETYDFSRQVGVSPWNALFVPESTISPSAAGLNLDTCFRGPADSVNKYFQEVVTLRQNWTDSRATWLGCMGGADGTLSHDMMQSGTFQLATGGKKWFVDLSSEGYDVPNHNTHTPNLNGRDRWDYYRNRAEGHNTIIINPDGGPDRVYNSATRAVVLNYQSAPTGQQSHAVIDLTPKIKNSTRVYRGFQLLNGRKDVLVQDEITMPTASTVWWVAHYQKSANTVTISPDGKEVLMTQASERLWGRILSPTASSAIWQNREATPLPGAPNVAERANNDGYGKLAINLTGVTDTTLAVYFVPLATGQNPPTTWPAVTPVGQWDLVSQQEPPSARDSTAQVVAGQSVDVSLRSLCSDDWTPVSQLSFATTSATGGTVSLLADGYTARFSLQAAASGSPSFSFTATDADGLTSRVATVTVASAVVSTTWNATTSGNWSQTSQWLANQAPSSSAGSQVSFFSGQTLAAGLSVTATNNIATPMRLNALTLAGTGTATTRVVVAGNPLELVSNGPTKPVVSLQGVTTGFTYDVTVPLSIADDTRFSGTNSGTFHFSGGISGPGGITRTDAFSTLILSGTNTYAGPTTISAGTLQIGRDGATGTLGGGAVVNNGTLRFDRTGTLLVPNEISGTGGVTIDNPIGGVVELSGANSFAGAVSVATGTLRVTSDEALGTTAGTTTVQGGSAQAKLELAGNVTVADRVILNMHNTATHRQLRNAGGVNTITGDIFCSSGGVRWDIEAADGKLLITGDVVNVVNAADTRTLYLTGTTNGMGEMAGEMRQDFTSVTNVNLSSGHWTYSGPAKTYTGSTTVSGGTLRLAAGLASDLTVSAGGTLEGIGPQSAATTLQGRLKPGLDDSAGRFVSTGTMSFSNVSTLECEVSDNLGMAYDSVSAGAITVASGARIAIALNAPHSVANLRHSYWRTARSWPLVAGTSVSGTFTLGTISPDSRGNAVATYGAFALQHTTTGVNLLWTPIPGFPVLDQPVFTRQQPASSGRIGLTRLDNWLRLQFNIAGNPSSVVWSVLNAEGNTGVATFTNANAADTLVSFSEPGLYTLRCTAGNDVGTSTHDVEVAAGFVDAVTLYEGDGSGLSHPATTLRQENPTRNSGARNLINVGKGDAAYRGLLAFDLGLVPNDLPVRSATLDLWTEPGTAGLGSVGAVELRPLLRAFSEGTGSGSVDSSGAGTGATWTQATSTDPWTTAGGDFGTTVLSSVPGFNATVVNQQKTFASTPEFVDEVNSHLGTGDALALLLISPTTESGAAADQYCRFATDDHATLGIRPRLTLVFDQAAVPAVSTGPVPEAVSGTPAALAGTVGDATTMQWLQLSGPGTVAFVNSTSASTAATFSAVGSYWLRLRAVNAAGEAAQDVNVLVTAVPVALPPFISSGSAWRYLTPSADPGSTWPTLEFNDAAWPLGTAEIGYGDGGEITPIDISAVKPQVVFVRKAFAVTADQLGVMSGLQLRLMRDDGAVVFLNGHEVYRDNMPTGPLAWNAGAATSISNADEIRFFDIPLDTSYLVVGQNVLAISIHQKDANSSDISFDASLTAVRGNPDLDTDGLTDAWEIRYFDSTAPATANTDSDLDGLSEFAEMKFYTDPTNSESGVKLSPQLNGNQATLTWPSVSGVRYRVYRSGELQNWQAVTGTLVGTGASMSFTEMLLIGEKAFYRLVAE